MVVCCMLLPQTPTDYPSTTHGTSVGSPVAVNIDLFVDISDFWASVLFELYGYSTPMTTSLGTKNVHFIGQCWYFNPQWTPVQAIKLPVSEIVLVSWDKMRSYYVSTYISWFVEGFGRLRGYILAPQSNPDLQGSCSLASYCSFIA
jgi:hypothetical protein